MTPFWRNIAATAIDPASGFNRMTFGDRYGAVFSSHEAAYFSQLAFGYSGSVKRDLGSSTADFKRNEAQLNFSIDYGLPGRKGYEYTRPFDYFNFQTTASSANCVENVLTRGLLAGMSYEAGPNYRGVWGIYGSYDYIAPQTFRIEHGGLARLDGAMVVGQVALAAGHLHARPRLRGGGHDTRRRRRARLQLRRRTADLARAATDPGRHHLVRPDRTRSTS